MVMAIYIGLVYRIRFEPVDGFSLNFHRDITETILRAD